MDANVNRGPDAIVVGAGVAGPAVALGLARLGLRTTVYEAAPSPRDGAGLFLNLAPNGLNAAQALGVGDEVEALGFLNDRLAFQNEDGRPLAEVAVGGRTMMRGALSQTLRDAAGRAGARFEFGMPLVALRQEEGRVVAHFADGTTVCAALLVGADGVHSQTRRLLFPGSPAPRYTGVLNIGGRVHTALPATGTTMRMIFGRRAFFGYAVQESGETYWFSNVVRRREPAHGSFVVDASAFRDQLLVEHEGDPDEVTTILRAAGGELGAFAVYDLDPVPSWSRGAACLVGDAAHAIGPHAGQGVSLALEDALVLAHELASTSDATLAFQRFELARRGRVTRVAEYARATAARKAPAGWLGRRLRDAIVPFFLRKSAAAAAELYHYRFDRSPGTRDETPLPPAGYRISARQR